MAEANRTIARGFTQHAIPLRGSEEEVFLIPRQTRGAIKLSML
jgi:hypothetical protein